VNVNLGRRTGGYHFNGRIDDVRIYDRALTAAELQVDMNTPLGSPPPPPAPPAAPVLATPSDGASGVATNGALTWNASAGATSYRVQVSTDPGFASTVADQANLTTTSYAPSGLVASTVYYWHVNASNGGGTSGYSAAWSFTTVAPPPPASGLVAGYALDEGVGPTAADVTGHGLTGTLAGATWTTAGKYGAGLSFNGTSGYVELGNPALLQTTGSMTWSGWVNAAANPGDDGQIIAKSDDNTGWQLKSSPDTGPHTFGIAITGSGGTRVQRYSTTVRALNTWYHVAGVYDAGARTLDLYVNGALDNGVLSGTVPAAQVIPGVNVNLGRRTGGYHFNGRIDDVRIYDRALTAAELQVDMNTPLGAPPVAVGEETIPTGYSLDQNFPNPIASTTTYVSFRLPQSVHVKLEVFNVLGKRIAVIVNEDRASGVYVERFDPAGLSSGVYFVRLVAGRFTGVRKMVLMR